MQEYIKNLRFTSEKHNGVLIKVCRCDFLIQTAAL